MTLATPSLSARHYTLAPLGGWPLLAYRLGWWGLVALAVGTVGWSWLALPAPLGIVAARTVKAVVLFTVAAILFRRRTKDPVAAMLATSFLLWTISSSVDFMSGSALPLVLDRFRFLLFALALLLFPDGRWHPAWTRLIALAIIGTFLLGIAEIMGLLRTGLFLPVAIGCVLASLAALLFRYRLLDEGVQKQQLKWVVLGLVLGIGLILTARAGSAMAEHMAMPTGGDLLLEAMFQLGIVIVALGFLTSMLRYRLYDAEAAISRSAVGAALTFALVGIFAGSEVLVELLGQQMFGMSIGNISGAIAAAVAAMMLTPLHHRISQWAEDHFQRDLAVLKHDLPDQLADLAATTSLARLGQAALLPIVEAVQATRACLLVDGKLVASEGLEMPAARKLLEGWKPDNDGERIHRDDMSPFPLQLALRCPFGSTRGWLLLGLRPDGTYYGRDDLDALAEIALPLQRAALLVADREVEARRRRRLETTLGKRIDVLDRRLAFIDDALSRRAAMTSDQSRGRG